MLLEALSIGTSLLGGALQSKAADKAKDAQEAASQRAMQAQQKAAGEVRQINAPGVAAYNTGLNALTGRLGLPTQGVASAGAAGQQGGAFDPQAYLAANPDIAAEYSKLSPNNLKNNLGVSTPEEFAQWHYNQYGQYEGRQGSPAAPRPQTQDPTATNALSGAPTGPAAGSFGNTADPAAFKYDQADYQASPGYQYRMDEALKGVLGSASATGALQSGAALKALSDRASKVAYDDFGQERDFARGIYESDRGYLTDRYDQGTSDLFKYTGGLGQNALTATSNAQLGEGTAVANNYLSSGQSQADGALAQGNIWGNTVDKVAGGIAGLVQGNALKSAMPYTPLSPISYQPAAKPGFVAGLQNIPQVRF